MTRTSARDIAVPFILSADANALVKRSSRLARFIEDCARWVTDGWRAAAPPFSRLLLQAMTLVYGRHASDRGEQELSAQLMGFLSTSFGSGETTHAWPQRFSRELVTPWRAIARNSEQEWDVCDEMISGTDPCAIWMCR
ncbi:hypothetical protein [Mesorhizobium sp.]|uniref:hypothetical protein n=1 Tax=Mesorhizobium sp. TaxID=1871066 RepID=UPI0025BB970A|nr:hypothetical protein [Mesorhizobium sp.]